MKYVSVRDVMLLLEQGKTDIGKLPMIDISDDTFTRCKQCKHLTRDKHDNGIEILWCEHLQDDLMCLGMNDYDFCSKGERR